MVQPMEEGRSVNAGSLDWQKFEVSFLDRLFPLDMEEAKVIEILNIRQGNMSVIEYTLKFTQLSRYAPTMISIQEQG